MKKLEYCLANYFLNFNLFYSTLDTEAKAKIDFILVQHDKKIDFLHKVRLNSKYMEIAIDFIQRKKVRPLDELLITNTVQIGKLITFERAIYFKNLQSTKDSEIYFHLKLPEFNNIKIHGKYHTRHYTCDTAFANLRSRYRVFLLGLITDISSEEIQIRPILFADRLAESSDTYLPLSGRFISRVNPDDIDEFKNAGKVSHGDIKLLRDIPEATIKNYFAEILNEANVPLDWAGESSDLYTTNIHLKGERMRAAFIFKGPAKFHPMKVKDLGKNGDQIIRLFTEPAELYVLQHCHFVSSTVESIMEAFATKNFSMKKYMIIDGQDTVRILKAYSKV